MYAKLISLFCLFIFSCSLYSAENKALVPIHEWQTNNGVRVLWVPLTEQPIVDIQLMLHAGSAEDGAAFGLANLTANLLDEGTAKLSADKIAENFDNVSALYNAAAGRDATILNLRSLSKADYLNPALQNLASVINEPRFPQQAVIRVKNETVQAIASDEQSPDGIATRAFYKALYGAHPYAHSPLGDKNTIQTIQRSDIEHFYKQYYNAANAVLVIVGDVDEAKVHIIAQQLVGHLPHGQKAAALPTPTSLTTAKNITVPFPTTQTSIRTGTLGITYNDPDFYALAVGNYIFGGGSLTSRLFQNVREKQGLTYSIKSAFVPLQVQGPFAIGLQTQNSTRTQALQTVNTTLTDFIDKGPSQSELVAAQKNIIGSFPLALSGNDNICAAVARIAFYDLPLDYLDQYRNHIAAVTVEDINKAIAAHLKGKHFVTIVVTQEDKVKYG
ncbi:MAG: peptidase [Gammaproteobacteria bacterium]|jgi:zinc protease|nr:peptidase [Gammaproteobacteria bacterium]